MRTSAKFCARVFCTVTAPTSDKRQPRQLASRAAAKKTELAECKALGWSGRTSKKRLAIPPLLAFDTWSAVNRLIIATAMAASRFSPPATPLLVGERHLPATGTRVLCAKDVLPATRSALGATTTGRRLVAALDAGSLPRPKPGLLPRRGDGVSPVPCSFH